MLTAIKIQELENLWQAHCAPANHRRTNAQTAQAERMRLSLTGADAAETHKMRKQNTDVMTPMCPSCAFHDVALQAAASCTVTVNCQYWTCHCQLSFSK